MRCENVSQLYNGWEGGDGRGLCIVSTFTHVNLVKRYALKGQWGIDIVLSLGILNCILVDFLSKQKLIVRMGLKQKEWVYLELWHFHTPFFLKGFRLGRKKFAS